MREDCNPPNVPKARPIEDFWAILSRAVYDNGWEPKNLSLLKRRIKQKIKSIDMSVVRTMMTKVRPMLRSIEEDGPFTIL